MTSVQSTTVAAIGVGIDASRYGHHVTFLRDDLQPATKPIAITETREGYHQLLSTLQDLKRRHPHAVFQIRLDEASLYAVNLRTFLYTLPFEKTISIGDCIRNKNYRYDFRGRKDQNFFPEGAFSRVSSSRTDIHSFSKFVNGKDWFATRPEYFSLVRGKRVPALTGAGPGQLCLTHPGVLGLTLTKLRELITTDRAEASTRLRPNFLRSALVAAQT